MVGSTMSWIASFVLSDFLQLAVVLPRMLSCASVSRLVPISYALGVLGDALWHAGAEGDATTINVASLFYLMGTVPFVYGFFAGGGAGAGAKLAMAALYAFNVYTFGDPTNVEGTPHFLEKHMANHVGSTLFYFVAANAKYLAKGSSGRKEF